MTPDFKEAERQAIAKAVRKFRKDGGKITRLPYGVKNTDAVLTWNNRNAQEIAARTSARNNAQKKRSPARPRTAQKINGATA